MRHVFIAPAAALVLGLLAACGSSSSSSDLGTSTTTPKADAGKTDSGTSTGGGTGTGGTGGGTGVDSGTGGTGGGGTGGGAGTSTCGDIITCLNACAQGDTACEQGCVDAGSATGQSQFGALNTCLNNNCANAQTQAEYNTCAQQNCMTELQGCDGLGAGGGSTGADAGGGGGATGNPDTTVICQACTTDANCGSGNFCVQNHCAAGGCTSSAQCGAGNSCFNLTSGGQQIGTACFPTSQTCGGTTPAADAGAPRDAGSTTRDAGSAACTTDTYANYAKSFFQSNCDGCHGHAFGTSYATFSVSKSGIQSRISSGNMPPSGLAAATKTRILKWISCGAPQ